MMKTFYTIIGTLLLTGLVSICGAQHFEGHPGRDSEKAKALKVGIYTSVLQLTKGEAEKFWPVYNTFHEQQEATRKQMRSLMKEIQEKYDQLSDSEMEKKIDEMVRLKKRESELFETYYENSKKALPIKKVALIPKAEMMYKRELLAEMRSRKGH